MFLAREGRTVLFVSHNIASVSDLTHRAVLLEFLGRITAIGPTELWFRVTFQEVAQPLRTCAPPIGPARRRTLAGPKWSRPI